MAISLANHPDVIKHADGAIFFAGISAYSLFILSGFLETLTLIGRGTEFPLPNAAMTQTTQEQRRVMWQKQNNCFRGYFIVDSLKNGA